ncbi:General odorant-binding protein 56d [Camponotus floridanus]|uniref:General odorant-binding protein 56d n=1 Tax=Camponotus floridanus TaxID=104421 RepID=E2AD33_CAMFO|nr:General odorant-binding protein 56d [Camponotus floridanus]
MYVHKMLPRLLYYIFAEKNRLQMISKTYYLSISIVVENAKNGQVAEGDEKLACFGNCILKKLGIINANGDIDWEVARSKVPPGISQEQIDHVYNKCQNVAGSGCEKGANLLKCFKENKNFAVLS